MFNKLRTYFKEGFSYNGVEVRQSATSDVYMLLELKQHKKELLVSQKKEFRSLAELAANLKKNFPTFLCVNTTGVLTKKVANGNTAHSETIVNQSFPNLDLSNFYYELIQTKQTPVVTIAKKDPVNQLIQQLTELNIRISRFHLGVSALESALPYLADGSVPLAHQRLTIENHRIVDVSISDSDTETEYAMNGLQLSSNDLLCFSSILSHLNQSPHLTNFEDVSEDLKGSFKNQRIFQKGLKYSLVFFIVLLLSNFFVYNSYHEKVATLNATLNATSSQKEELTLLNASVERKQERVETLSASSNSRATYYLDLFAQHIPASILLNEIKYQPLLKPVRENKPVILEEGQLLVAGVSKDVDLFSSWVEAIEKYPWVHSVETLDYDYISNDTSSFLIEIALYEN